MSPCRIALLQITCHPLHAIRHGGTLRQIRQNSLDGWHFGATLQQGFDFSADAWGMGSCQVGSLGLFLENEWFYDTDYRYIGIHWQLRQDLPQEEGGAPCVPSACHAYNMFVWLAFWMYYSFYEK